MERHRAQVLGTECLAPAPPPPKNKNKQIHRLKLDLQCDGTRRCGPCREARFRRGHEATRMSTLPITGEEGRPALPPHAGRTPGRRLSASQGETPPQHLARRLPASSAVRRNCLSRLPRSAVPCDRRPDGPRPRACSGNPGAPLWQPRSTAPAKPPPVHCCLQGQRFFPGLCIKTGPGFPPHGMTKPVPRNVSLPVPGAAPGAAFRCRCQDTPHLMLLPLPFMAAAPALVAPRAWPPLRSLSQEGRAGAPGPFPPTKLGPRPHPFWILFYSLAT